MSVNDEQRSSTWFGGTGIHSVVSREELAAKQVSQASRDIIVQQFVPSVILPTGYLLAKT